MNITATLFAQIAAFLILIWMVNRLLWGPMTAALQERRRRIADGLSAAEESKRHLAETEEKVARMEREARTRAAEIITGSEKRAHEIVEEAKAAAREEGERIKTAARHEVDRQVEQAREQLSHQVAQLAVAGAERILAREIDRSAHVDALKGLEDGIREGAGGAR